MNDSKPTSKKTQSKPDTKTESKSDTKAEAKPAGTSSSPPDGGGKSAKESVGGAAAGHYGYFSNIKTPEYKSGWDDIWGKESKPRVQKKSGPKAAPKPKTPVFISIDFEDLPSDIRDILANKVRAQLKKKRISYDARAKKGDVDWTIDCKVYR